MALWVGVVALLAAQPAVLSQAPRADRSPHRSSPHTRNDSLRILDTAFFNSSPGPASENPHAITTDDSGNTYIAGTGSLLPNGSSYLVLKVDPAGIVLWTARYNNNTPMSSHAAGAIAVDGTGNVIVTGISEGPSGDNDMATVKFSPEGAQIWAVRYDGGTGSNDVAVALALDPVGNIYVAGSTTAGGKQSDLIVLKYRSDGSQVWSVTYDGTNHLDDDARTMAITPTGELVLAANATNANGDSDFLTVCLDSSGALRWAARYDTGPGFDDRVSGLAVNASGNVFVTGLSTDPATSHGATTVSYSPAGAQRWLARYVPPDRGTMYPQAIAADPLGNLVITGDYGEGGYPGMGTIAYDSMGSQRWMDVYDDPTNDLNTGRDVAISQQGSIYVVGESRDYFGAPGYSNDFVAIKYAMDGSRAWVRHYNGQRGGNDRHTSCVLDRHMNLTVTGQSEGMDQGYDIAVVRYDSLGEEKWVTRFNGEGSANDIPTAIATDAHGNIYLLARGRGVDHTSAMVLCKFDQSHVLQWAAPFCITPDGYDHFSLLSVDGEGNAIVCGAHHASIPGGESIVTVKYDASGNRQWMRSSNSVPYGFGYPSGLRVDSQGNIIVLGSTSINSHFVIKYDRAGNEMWSSGSPPGDEGARGLYLDNSGNIYSILPRSDPRDGITVFAQTPDGDIGWTADWSVPDAIIYPYTLLADRYGCVYVLSQVEMSGPRNTFTLSKFSPLGSLMWTASEEPPAESGWWHTCKMLLDEAGDPVLAATGSWAYPSRLSTVVLMSFDGTGRRRERISTAVEGRIQSIHELRALPTGGYGVVATTLEGDLIVLRYPGHDQNPVVHSLSLAIVNGADKLATINPDGAIVLAGNRSGPGWATSVILTVGGVDLSHSSQPFVYAPTVRLDQNYPNPFNNATMIHFGLAAGGPTQVTVYNTLGQIVARLVDGMLPAGEHNTIWNAGNLASGVYVIAVQTAAGRDAKRTILIK